MNKIVLIIVSLILALVAGLAGCTAQSVTVTKTLPAETVTVTQPAETITVTLPQPTVTPQDSLPKHRPQIPPTIVGSATLEPLGTNIMLDGFPASRAFSEYFNFSVIAKDRYTEELLVNIIVCSDCLNSYKVREPGWVFFKLSPCYGQGLWEFSPERLVYENLQTFKDGQILYTTEVMGKLRSRGDFYKFRIEITNFDTDKHNVSWEIYVWRET